MELPPDIRRLSIDLQDDQKEQIYGFFNTSYYFIDSNLHSTNVLVHCMAGVSRSATLVIAYLMRKYRMHLEKAKTLVMEKRPFINPNPGFIRQLEFYDKELAKDRCSLI